MPSPLTVSSSRLRLFRLPEGALNSAVIFGMSLRVWQLAAGVLSALLLSRFLSPKEQGFYYTFASLVALQTFVELGLHSVVLNVSSHEWAKLRLDLAGRIEGDREALSRLASLVRQTAFWYGGVALLFLLAVGSAGFWFLSQQSQPDVHWQLPWLALVFVTSGLLFALPFLAVLEGCGQIAIVYRFRLVQAVVSVLASWGTLLLGFGLWSSPLLNLTGLLVIIYLVVVQYRGFFLTLARTAIGATVVWRREIWPLQWRIGLSGLVAYFFFSLFVPVLFTYQGPVVAGQMGMTLSIATAVQTLGLIWVQTRAPAFGVLAARRDFSALDRLWLRVTAVGAGVAVLAGLGGVALVIVLNLVQLPIAGRLLDPLPTAILVLASVANVVPLSMSLYLRAHKREPLLAVSLVSSLLNGLLVWLGGMTFGAMGVVVAYAGVILFVIAPWMLVIWLHSRREWHREPTSLAV
ncbi:MAG: hypothetical protein U0556_19480 [Dehalococcoidia bacterium]